MVCLVLFGVVATNGHGDLFVEFAKSMKSMNLMLFMLSMYLMKTRNP